MSMLLTIFQMAIIYIEIYIVSYSMYLEQVCDFFFNIFPETN